MSAHSDAYRILRLVEDIGAESTSDTAIEERVRRHYEDQRLSEKSRTNLKGMLFGCAPQIIERTAAGPGAADGIVFPHGVHTHN